MGKKILGTKRHIAVETQGLPYVLAIIAGNINTDRNGALLAFEQNKEGLKAVKAILVEDVNVSLKCLLIHVIEVFILVS